MTAELDADFLWEAAGTDEFGFEQLTQEYYGHTPQPAESVALLLKLHGSPIYFHKKGKGRYRPAPAETLAAAKAGLEKKRLAAERQAKLAEELAAFRLPEEYASLIPRILIAPDKNTLEYKALEDAAAATGLSQLRLIERCGAIPSTLEFHQASFQLEYFPRGTGFADVTEPIDPPELPRSTVRAFSMDDEATTEIDDALVGAMAGRRQHPRRHPHRRARTRHRTRIGARQGGARTAVDRVFPRQQDHHAAGRADPPLHAG